MSQNRASARLETGDDSVSKRDNATVDQRTIEEIQGKQEKQTKGGKWETETRNYDKLQTGQHQS